MARTDTLGNFLTDVADAIREKKGTSETIQASQFDTEIANLPGGGLDWSAIGYEDTPQSIVDGYSYAKEIYDNWIPAVNLHDKFNNDKNLIYMPLVDTSNTTNMLQMFGNCTKLITIPLLNTSNVTDMISMFSGCEQLTTIPLLNTSNVTDMTGMFSGCEQLITIPLLNTSNVTIMQVMFTGCAQLTTIPLLNTSKVTNMNSMFNNCTKLTDESLDNILQMCINATAYAKTKTLASLGIKNTKTYPVSRIEALEHYQDFINAGWTI